MQFPRSLLLAATCLVALSAAACDSLTRPEQITVIKPEPMPARQAQPAQPAPEGAPAAPRQPPAQAQAEAPPGGNCGE
jgi:hypothetical protein